MCRKSLAALTTALVFMSLFIVVGPIQRVNASSGESEQILDSLTSGDYDATLNVSAVHPSADENKSAFAQIWKWPIDVKITKISLVLWHHGTPTGWLSGRLYNTTGTYGSSAYPIESEIISESLNSIAMGSVGNWVWYNFTFSDVAITRNQAIAFAIYAKNATLLDTNNYLSVMGVLDDLKPGNQANFNTSTWNNTNSLDLYYYVYGMPEYYGQFEHYNTGDSDIYTFSGSYWAAQTFTVNSTADHTITSVRLKMRKNTSPGMLTVSIRATDGNGKPTDSDLTTGTIDANTFTSVSPGAWYEVPLTRYTLLANTKYGIVCRAGNWIVWRWDTMEPSYADGDALESFDNGVTWSLDPPLDFMFEVWGYSPALLTIGEFQAPTMVYANEPFFLNATVNDPDGRGKISNASIEIHSSLVLAWVNSTDTFSEQTDTNNYCTLTPESCVRANVNSTAIKLSWYLKLNSFPAGSVDVLAENTEVYDVYGDSSSGSQTELFALNYITLTLQARDAEGTNLPKQMTLKGTMGNTTGFEVTSNTTGAYQLTTCYGSHTINVWWTTHLVATATQSITSNTTLNIDTKVRRLNNGGYYVLFSLNNTDLTAPYLVGTYDWRIEGLTASGVTEFKMDNLHWLSTGAPKTITVGTVEYTSGWTFAANIFKFSITINQHIAMSWEAGVAPPSPIWVTTPSTSLTLTAQIVNLGEVQKGATKTFQIRLVWSGTFSVIITNVSCTMSWITYQVELPKTFFLSPGASNGAISLEVSLTISAAAPSGSHDLIFLVSGKSGEVVASASCPVSIVLGTVSTLPTQSQPVVDMMAIALAVLVVCLIFFGALRRTKKRRAI